MNKILEFDKRLTPTEVKWAPAFAGIAFDHGGGFR